MQWAEGPESFDYGFRKMLSRYEEDIPRTAYIRELYADDEKALFKKEFKFSNAVLVDVCESLFHAFKQWVFGSSGKSASLLMSMVRIVEGCRLMVLKPFLKNPDLSRRVTVRMTNNRSIQTLFEYLCGKLTQWAVKFMYDKLDRSRGLYNTFADDNGTTTVTHRKHGDTFDVDEEYQCHIGHKRCWQQLYTGLPCVHSLLAGVENLTMCDDEDTRSDICVRLFTLCNSNWHRHTYSNATKEFRTSCFVVPPPKVKIPKFTTQDPLFKFKIRFNRVIRFLPSRVIETFLQRMEVHSLQQSKTRNDVLFTPRALTTNNDLLNDTDTQITMLHTHGVDPSTTPQDTSETIMTPRRLFQNPARRVKKRAQTKIVTPSTKKPRRKSRHENGGYNSEQDVVNFCPSSSDNSDDCSSSGDIEIDI